MASFAAGRRFRSGGVVRPHRAGRRVAGRRLARGRAHGVLELEHERGRAAVPPTAIEIALGEPTSREGRLVRLLRERLGRVELAAPVIAVRPDAKDVREADAPSESLFPEPGGSPQDHARLMELLVARLGAQSVLKAAPVADHRPSVRRRWPCWNPAAATTASVIEEQPWPLAWPCEHRNHKDLRSPKGPTTRFTHVQSPILSRRDCGRIG